ncbi:putative rRNA maturation factor [Desulfobaculum xiamenense]|uniref:Endoribonuclease YbeY n=1 Tax=Desulfobaculum xiamenense TaxID=995050 RepID=A0A846QK79_9BACT|nr:rRNA maturation RNase YbeY [Desulfobaculum xiamenense]NJB67460.1 putative rRNA maturation factor [Desulfobaculum xiamenense]
MIAEELFEQGRIVLDTHAALNPTLPLSPRGLLPVVRLVLAVLGMPEAEVEIIVVDDANMAHYHHDFKGRTGPTNVLSFPDEDPERPNYIGQVVLSADTLAREAVLYGQIGVEHLARLLAHAFLHLAGYPHGEEMEALTEAAVDAVAMSLDADDD